MSDTPPESKAEIRERARQRQNARGRERYANDPDYKQKQKERALKSGLERYHNDPEYRERVKRQSAKQHEAIKQDPVELERRRERARDYQRVRRTDPYSRGLIQKAKHKNITKNRQDHRWVERERVRQRESRKRNPKHKELQRIAIQRRLARKKALPDTLTVTEWQFALDYFHGCCAVCGRQLNDLFGNHTAHADHWIPLVHPACPGTVATNIVPLCGGQGGCNNKKNAKRASVWLREQYPGKQAEEIERRIAEYFEHVRTKND